MIDAGHIVKTALFDRGFDFVFIEALKPCPVGMVRVNRLSLLK